MFCFVEFIIIYSRTPVTRTLKGNEQQFELGGGGGIRVIGVNFSEILIKERKFRLS